MGPPATPSLTTSASASASLLPPTRSPLLSSVPSVSPSQPPPARSRRPHFLRLAWPPLSRPYRRLPSSAPQAFAVLRPSRVAQRRFRPHSHSALARSDARHARSDRHGGETRHAPICLISPGDTRYIRHTTADHLTRPTQLGRRPRRRHRPVGSLRTLQRAANTPHHARGTHCPSQPAPLEPRTSASPTTRRVAHPSPRALTCIAHRTALSSRRHRPCKRRSHRHSGALPRTHDPLHRG